ncbi:MAG: carbohydrate ABC transporter permease [Chloroflexi bacterium]|nr:carbohydrate ABC transporter permease [Chloroflexota bacterium]
MTVAYSMARSWQRFRANPSRILLRVLLYILLVIGAVIFAMPFVWMVRTSVMPGWQAYAFPPQWIPARIDWSNWRRPWEDYPFALFFRNSAFYAIGNVTGSVISTSIAAYAFARLKFRGRDVLFIMVLSTMMLPFQVTLIPQYVLFTKLGWVNTYKPLIVPAWLAASGFNIFLFRQYYMTIPRDLDEAAKIDGCSLFGIYWRILLPLSMPAFGVVAIQQFTFAWNNFMGPLIYLNHQEKFTVSLALRLFQTHYTLDMQALMAATIVALIPVITLFFIAQRYFVQGIVITGVKG